MRASLARDHRRESVGKSGVAGSFPKQGAAVRNAATMVQRNRT
jgi:hypothetical protein